MTGPPGRVLVTGASGFLGRHVLAALGPQRGVGLSVRPGDPLADRIAEAAAGAGPVDAVVHLGGRAHVLAETSADVEAVYRRDNATLTEDLARAAAGRGIRRFVFVSTILVHGRTRETGAMRPDDPPAPDSAYARSKLAAESALGTLARAEGLEVAVVRPTLVYGAGARGNLDRLASAIERGLPLPLGLVRNRRSLTNAADLADLLVLLTGRERVPDAPLLAADDAPVSTADLARALGRALGRPARLVPVPTAVLRPALRLAGRGAMADQLLGSQVVDTTRTRAETGWRPTRGLEAGLAAFAAERRTR